MQTLDEQITSWMQSNAGVVCSTTFTNMGLNPWRCCIHLMEKELARASGPTELEARQQAFRILLARRGAPRSYR